MTSKERDELCENIRIIERNTRKKLQAEIDMEEADHKIKIAKAKVSNAIKVRN